MLKWTSKGSLNSEDGVHSVTQGTTPWHKHDGVLNNSFSRDDPGPRLLAEMTDKKKLQLLGVVASNVPGGLKRKHSMRSEPNSPRGSVGDVRPFKSLSLPSSPQARKKQKYGVFKKLKNIFRKSKIGDPELVNPDFFIKKKMMAPGPNFHNKVAKVKDEKKGIKGKKGAPNTRLTRLIEAKREQRKSLSTSDEYRRAIQESRSFLTPSASSDEDGSNWSPHPHNNELPHGYLESFLPNNLKSFQARAESPMDRTHFAEMSRKYGATLDGVSPTAMSRSTVDEPRVIARVIPRFEDELRIPNASPMRSSDDETDSLRVSPGNKWKEVAPSKVESFILDGSRYEYTGSPVHANQENKHGSYGGINGIKRPGVQHKGIKQENDISGEEVSFSSTSIKELTRSLSFIKESGSLEKVRVMFSSPESIVHARACLHPQGAGRQSPRRKSVSSPQAISNTVALYDDNEQWSFPDDERTLMYPIQDSSMNDLFFKEEVEPNTEYNHPNPPCTRNNNNGHHTSPLVIPTTFYDLQPGVNETLFKPDDLHKTDIKLEAFDLLRDKVTRNEEPFDAMSLKSSKKEKPFDLTKNKVEKKVEPLGVPKKKIEKKVRSLEEVNYIVETFKSISVINSSPSPKYGREGLTTSSATAVSDSLRSESDTRSSPLNVDHQSLLAIRPMKVKDIVDQIERDSLSSVPRYSPVERSAEKLPKGAELFRSSEGKRGAYESVAKPTTPERARYPVEYVPTHEQERMSLSMSSVTDPMEEKEFSAEDNFSFSLDDDTSSRSDAAERELMPSESSSFQLSEHIIETTNTYASDTNAFCSDNSDALTSSSYSKGVEEIEKDSRFAPVVHLVCNSMIDSACFDTKSEKDCQAEMVMSDGVNPCIDITQSADTVENTEMDATFLVSIVNFNERSSDVFIGHGQTDDKRRPVHDDRIKLCHSSTPPERNAYPGNREEESCMSVSGMSSTESMVHGAEDHAVGLTDDSCRDEEGIMDVLAPELAVMTDSSLKELMSETLENKSALTETNAVLQDLNTSFKDDQDTEQTISAANGEISLPVNAPHEPDNSVFYMPSCALEEFSDALNIQQAANEKKMKKKVSFKLEITSPEESSASDDRAVLETTLPRRQGQSELSLNQESVRELKRSPDSSTDISVSDLSARSSDLQVGLTPPVTSTTSGDDFSWWGTENIEELDFFHDRSPLADKSQALTMINTDVARSSATENLLHEEEEEFNMGFDEPGDDLPDEDGGATSNILTLSSFLTSGSIFNKGEQEQESFFLAVDNEAVQPVYQEIANDASQGTFDEKSWLHSDAYTRDKSVNKQSEHVDEHLEERVDDKRQGLCDGTLSNKMNNQPMIGEINDQGDVAEDDLPEVDLTSDINTHTYNVTRDETPDDKDGLAWWEKCPGSSATNYSLGSFEVDSHDESNTLSEIYNQLKKPNKPTIRTSKKRNSVLKKRVRVAEANNKQKNVIKKKSPQKVSQQKKAFTSKTNKGNDKMFTFETDIGSVELNHGEESPQKSSPENPQSEEKVSKEFNNDERKSRYLDRNDADREQKSITEHPKSTKRSTVTQESIELKTEAAVETDSSVIPQRIRTLANKKDRQVKIEKIDSDHSIVQTTSSRKSNRNRTLWTKSSSESVSNVSDSQCASDDDCRLNFYSHGSPYFIDNLNECVSSYASTGGIPYLSLSSVTQYGTESCVIDNFADNDSSLDMSETSTEQIESNSPVYNENSKEKIRQNVTDDCTPDKANLSHSQKHKEIFHSHYQVVDLKDHEAMNRDDCLHQATRDHFNKQKEVHRNNNVFLSRIEPNDGFHSSKSLTLAVADSDTTTASDMFNSDNTMRHMHPGNDRQGVKAKVASQNVDFMAINGQNKQTIHQSAVMGASTRLTGRHQQNDFYDHHSQSNPQPPDQGEAWHQRARMGGSGGGDNKLTPHSRRDLPEAPSHSGTLCAKEDHKVDSKPGEWLFIASFFVFQLFMHWMYAA